MRIGVPREAAADERRVALVPDVAARLAAAGHEVVVEPGAGRAAQIPDAFFAAAGARAGDPWDTDVVAKVAPPMAREVELLAGRALVAFLAPLALPDVALALAAADVTAFAMDAGPLDARTRQERVAGHQAVLLAAGHASRPVARVLVAGDGPAARQAAVSAERLGATASRWTGALPVDLSGFDAVIAAAPALVADEAVRRLRPGSVIVDLAAEAGGSCELAEPGGAVVRHDVTIVAPLNLAAARPQHASALYARDVHALLARLADASGAFAPDFDDDAVAGACITRDGAVVDEDTRRAMEASTAQAAAT